MAFRIEAASCGTGLLTCVWRAQRADAGLKSRQHRSGDLCHWARASIITYALMAFSASAQPFALAARHRHPHRGTVGALTLTDASLRFDDQGKHKSHSPSWDDQDIQ